MMILLRKLVPILPTFPAITHLHALFSVSQLPFSIIILLLVLQSPFWVHYWDFLSSTPTQATWYWVLWTSNSLHGIV